MENVVIVRYSKIGLKGNNRIVFERKYPKTKENIINWFLRILPELKKGFRRDDLLHYLWRAIAKNNLQCMFYTGKVGKQKDLNKSHN